MTDDLEHRESTRAVEAAALWGAAAFAFAWGIIVGGAIVYAFFAP